MSKSTAPAVVLVPASRIRAAFAAGEFTAPDEALASLIGRNGDGKVRGRLNPKAVEAFEAQVPGEQYAGEKSQVESRTVSLPLTKMNAAGARLKRPETFTLTEVRTLAGIEGKKGRISSANLTAAAKAVEASRGWDTKPAKAAPKTKATTVATVKVPQV